MPNYGQKGEQLCWTCIHAVPTLDGARGCSWSRYFEPVPGWTAKAVRRVDCGTAIQTYRIHKCPEYVKESRRDACQINET